MTNKGGIMKTTIVLMTACFMAVAGANDAHAFIGVKWDVSTGKASVVQVERRAQHPKNKKMIKRTSKPYDPDARNTSQIDDKVATIIEFK